MKLNAIELRDEHDKFQIKARIMLTGVNAAVLYPTWGTNEGDVVDITGWIKYSHGSMSMARAVRTVAITVEYVNGVRNPDFEWNFHTIVCNMGSHITVEITDPMDVEPEDSKTMGEELEAMFGMPDPDSDGMVCGMVRCAKIATHMGLDTDGETVVPVCEVDSYSTRWWAVWPIEEDSQFSGNVGTWENELDSVPPGTNRATPDWTGRVESAIRYAEYKYAVGIKGRNWLDAIVNEIARLGRIKRARLVVSMQTDLRADIMAGRIQGYAIDAALDKIDAVSDGVSLAKV